MARLVSLLLLLFFLVIVTSSDEVVSSSAADGVGLADDDPVCDIPFELCLGSCWKSGKCNNCCKDHGFIHGKCSPRDGFACYCCHTPDQRNEQQLTLSPSSSPSSLSIV